MKIKICGVTSVEDALMAAEAGANLIGLNFYPPSPRCVSRDTAGAIAAALRALPRPPTLVGVFVDESAAWLKAILDDCGLDLAQLSGDEPREVLEALGERGFKVMRGVSAVSSVRGQVSRLTHHREVSAWDASGLTHRPDLLLDAHLPGKYGGTGQVADWDTAAETAREFRILLAGGLTPENVAEAVRRVRPWGVDVASGVESSPGRKDDAKVRAFITSTWEASNGFKHELHELDE